MLTMADSAQKNGGQQCFKPCLESLLNIYLVRQCLMQYLDTRDLLRLYRTSWAIRLNLKDNDWNINYRLSRFFKNPMAFRSCLGRSNALISGSFALQFFERVSWPDSDLDIMVKEGDPLEQMGRHLVEAEGYSMVQNPNPWWDSYDVKDISNVIDGQCTLLE